MPDKLSNAATVAQQIELAIGRLDSLSTLPCIAAQFLSKLLHGQFSPSALADIIESDPALTALILSLIGRRGVSLPDGRFSLRQALDKLAAEDVRDAVLSVKVLQDAGLEGSGAFDLGDGPERDRIPSRRGLLLHSLAVACCAKDIAEAALPQMDSQLAYCAGLLHDIGKLALEETMPKSFARMVEEAESTKECSRAVEQKHLGADHTIIGKHLAAKWQLPNLIILGIWLHHSETVIISQDMPEARIAAVVQLADSIARQSGIGWSGSYDLPEPAEPIAQWLSVNSEQVQKIRRNLPETVRQKSRVLGLDLPKAVARYCDIAATTVAQLARRQTELSLENRRLQSASSHLDFTTDFLLNTNSAMGAVSIAENFATRWQKFYQTGMVCLYLAPSTGQPPAALIPPAFPATARAFAETSSGSQTLEAVVVESLSQSKVVSLNAPTETPAIPKSIANNFAILNAHEHIDWLFEQLDVDFDVNRTKLVPLLSAGRAIGAIAFELHYPGDIELFEERFKASTSIAAAVLDMALARLRQENFAERFVRLIGVGAERVPTKAEETEPRRPSAGGVGVAGGGPPLVSAKARAIAGKADLIKAAIGRPAEDPLSALAEMAAGAAHELNNPLLVISGRAQLLAEAESDREKKQILEQIQANAQKVSAIIEDLMSFAEPQQPRSARTAVRQIIDEAVELTCQKTNVEHINVQIEVAEDVEDVFVDSAQIVSAIANVISNAVESYSSGELGPIKITADADESGDMVRLTISDLGCGMDAKTLQKATQPFFSVRPAGRKRGMGLAYAARFVQLNKGSLDIESEPGSGTTVTICLPRK
jgi:putative nucleotidyltransferase with HDIG domain